MTFRDVHATRSWDLEARTRTSNRIIYIEVKGTIESQPEVEITGPELAHARRHVTKTALLVVTDIVLDRSVSPPTASGGQLHEFYPWDPQPSQLTPIRFRWRP
jgi:hypothetical protein